MKIFYYSVNYINCNNKTISKSGYTIAESEETATVKVMEEYDVRKSEVYIEEKTVIEINE